MHYFRGLFALNFSHIEIERSVPTRIDPQPTAVWPLLAVEIGQVRNMVCCFSCVLVEGAVAGSSGVTWSQALCLRLITVVATVVLSLGFQD